MKKIMCFISFITKSVISMFLLALILYFVLFIALAPKQNVAVTNTTVFDKISPYELTNNSITYNDNTNNFSQIPASTTSTAASAAANNIITPACQKVISNAQAMIEVKWIPKKNLVDKIAHYIFVKGKTYTGIPYSMDSYQAGSALDFLSKQNSTNYLVGNDCSGFVSAAWGIKRQTTLTLFEAAKKGILVDGKAVKEISWNDIKPGDALLHDNGKGKGHIMLYLSTDSTNTDSLTVYEQNVSTLVPFEPIPTARKDVRSKNALIKEGYFPIRLMTLN